MITCRHTPMKAFEIFAPKYSTKQVLLKAIKVGEHNKITFTKAPSMGTDPYYISGKNVKKYPKDSNGSIMCYSVPLEELEPLEYQDGCIHQI